MYYVGWYFTIVVISLLTASHWDKDRDIQQGNSRGDTLADKKRFRADRGETRRRLIHGVLRYRLASFN